MPEIICKTNSLFLVLFIPTGQLYGLEKFWAFLKYSKRNVDIDENLRKALANYQKLSDFRVEVSF